VSTVYEIRCIGTARLCDDDGMVTNPGPAYPDGYHCSGVSFVGTGVYVRCDNPRHTVVMLASPSNAVSAYVGAAAPVCYSVAAQPAFIPAHADRCPHCGRSS
jgi:hypothetical protein